MFSKRFMPLSDEIAGYLKTFIYAWIIWFVVFIFVMGLSWWSFYGGLGVSFIFAIFTTLVLAYWSAGGSSGGGGFVISQKGDPGNVGRHENYRDSWVGGGDGNLWE